MPAHAVYLHFSLLSAAHRRSDEVACDVCQKLLDGVRNDRNFNPSVVTGQLRIPDFTIILLVNRPVGYAIYCH